MPYVGSDGQLTQSRPFGLSLIFDFFYGTINFVNLFFRSLFHMDEEGHRGSGGSGPRMPGRMGGMRRTGGVAPPPCVGGG